MPRIFASLSVFTILLLSTALGIGFGWDLNEPILEWKDLKHRAQQIEQGSVGAAQEHVAMEEIQIQMDAVRSQFIAAREAGSAHILMGIISALFVVLVCSISVTYFIGTGRWCREVVEVYSLEPDLLSESQLLKRRAFPWAIVAILAALGVSALGAASDPGTGMKSTSQWVTPHLFSALAGICLIGYCLYSLWTFIIQNHDLLGRIMSAVHARRVEEGLESQGEDTVVEAMQVGP